jgi:hypothetical protein
VDPAIIEMLHNPHPSTGIGGAMPLDHLPRRSDSTAVAAPIKLRNAIV